MKKRTLSSLLAGLLMIPAAMAADYGLPSAIQQGNILHCFNWPAKDVKEALPQIAAAGFGSVQLSPMQRGDVSKGSPWHDLYRPYDLAFKSSGYCSEQDLKDLCEAAKEYGIKIIVDVVANHVDKTAGYHDTWWDSGGRVRWEGGINYGNRYSITHGQLGDYGDVNSENSEVAARGKAYVQALKNMGVSGIRWDAAKHIGLPSEGCQFWKEVTSVPGMWHYGEILDKPGPDPSIIKEYGTYMSVTDNEYCNYAAKSNGGVPGGYGGSWHVNYNLGDKVVYWGESHDTYSNDEWSQNVDQGTIDRAYAAYACRSGATALYLSRPNTKGFSNIKVGKGSTAFTSKHISEVNKFRNLMVGKADWCEAAGNTFCVTRKDGGAVIVMKGSGNVNVTNGGGYCPAGTYTDRVSGGTFTVTSTNISGNVGSSGIAVLIKDGVSPNPNPNPDPNPGPDPVPTGDMWILGNLEGTAGWSKTPGTGAAMTLTDGKYVANGVKMVAGAGETKCYFNLTDYVGATWDDLNMSANRYGAATEGAPITVGTPATVVKYANGVDASGCLSWTVAAGTYDFTFDPSAMTLTVVNAGDNPNPNPNPDPNPDPNPNPDPTPGDGHYIYYDGTFSQPAVWAWTSTANCCANGTWPGDAMTKKDGKWYWELPAGKPVPEQVIISENGGAKVGGGDLTYVDKATYHQDGTTSTGDSPNPNPNPNPDPTPGANVYVLGDFSDSHWSTSAGKAMTANGNVYTIEGLELAVNPNAAGATKAYFTFTTAIGADWDVVNGSDRYGASTKDEAIAAGETATVTKYPANVSASSAYSWAIEPGTYDLTLDLATMKLTVAESGDGPRPQKPVVTASPAGGTTFTDDAINVTLSVTPEATIYYSLTGAATTASTVYSGPIAISETTTIYTLAVTAEGAQNSQSFKYTKRSNNPGPEPGPAGTNLITDYYKVNPNGQVGTFKTVNTTGHPASNAFTNWSAEDLIAQGVARDVCQAFKGVHERPIVDSYALYAAYDNDNLYLGVQFVYTIWDLWGEGKQPGESKPYNMDGHMVIAFDLFPNKSFDGYINGTGPIWNEGAQGAKFDNGVDAVLMCSTKPGVGTPGLFLPTDDGHASYDAAYCKSLPAGFWGYKDGLHPSIDHVWGQDDFSYDPDLLKGNTGFVDLRSEIDDDAHTFYEFKIPLSSLGITADHIKNTGIGVMYLDKYGTSPVGGTPYDPSFFDNVSGSYSQDPSSSKEKEDEDVITYAPARIGKLGTPTGVSLPSVEGADMEPVYYTLQGVRVNNPQGGIFIVVRGNKVSKEYIR